MSESLEQLSRKSILIVLGTFESGLVYQLERILTFSPELFKRVVTYTTRVVSDEIDANWLRNFSKKESGAISIDDYFTSYQVEGVRYIVKCSDVRDAVKEDGIALLGMTSFAYDRFLSIEKRWQEFRPSLISVDKEEINLEDQRSFLGGIGSISHSVVALQPSDVSEFAHALMQDFRFDEGRARKCAQRAVACSTIPPRSSGEYRLQIPISGPRDDAVVQRLAQFITSRSR